MQAHRLRKLRAIGRSHPHIEDVAFALERQRHVDTGRAERPDAAKEIGEAGHIGGCHGVDDIAFTQARASRRAIAGEADDDDTVIRFAA